MTEQRKRVWENEALPTGQARQNAAEAGRIPAWDPKTPDAKKTLENYKQNLERLSKELDEYFSMRRLMPRE
ncbi:hypothetical protein [Methanoregula sp.]|jgi:hypothetical protein|uniref:hypothetical protein n=1 Tax=Methanoregula sp. TaxID=2052170 RepID=UPI002620C139|nr:hypothetical protein [Methanoregula sp.]MDD5142449.1 hypothetical protein [Methanoregula sp.]